MGNGVFLAENENENAILKPRFLIPDSRFQILVYGTVNEYNLIHGTVNEYSSAQLISYPQLHSHSTRLRTRGLGLGLGVLMSQIRFGGMKVRGGKEWGLG